jgi:hypothetical protein
MAQDLASIDRAGIVVASLEPAARARADAAQLLAQDLASIDAAGMAVAPSERVSDAAQVTAQDLASIDAARAAIASLRIETPAPRADGAWMIASDLQSGALRMGDRIMVAAVASVPVPIAPIVPSRAAQPAAAATPEVARMRAEVEAEIARDRERIADTLQSCAKAGSYRQGCAVGGAPKRFAFAGV